MAIHWDREMSRDVPLDQAEFAARLRRNQAQVAAEFAARKAARPAPRNLLPGAGLHF